MAISGRPQKPPSPAPAARPSEQEVRNLIHRGGSVANEGGSAVPASAKPMLVQLRLYPELIGEIDAIRKDGDGRRHRPPSRHAWIVQAIEEKLARDKPGP